VVGFIFCFWKCIFCLFMTFGTKGMGERGTKRLITVFAEAMSRVASRTSRVYRGEGRRHKSRRGSVAARKCLKTTKCCFSLSVTEPQ
jgi:hypothetical protein